MVEVKHNIQLLQSQKPDIACDMCPAKFIHGVSLAVRF